MTPMRTEGCGYGKTWCSCTSCSSNRCAWFFKEVCGSKRQSAWRSERWKYLWASWKLVVSATTVRKTLKKMMIVFMSHKRNHYLLMSSLFTKVQSVESRARCGGCSHVLDGGADLFAHFREFDGKCAKRSAPPSSLRIQSEWGMGQGWCGWRIYFHVIFGCNHFCLQLFMLQKSIHLDLILSESWQYPMQGKLEGMILPQSQSCVLWSCQSCLMSTVNYHQLESFALFQVFFPSFHLYLKGSSDLDRVGSMVGKQDWLKYGDRVQFAEMMDERSSAEFTWTELLSWATFDSDVYAAASGCMFWHLVPNRNS